MCFQWGFQTLANGIFRLVRLDIEQIVKANRDVDFSMQPIVLWILVKNPKVLAESISRSARIGELGLHTNAILLENRIFILLDSYESPIKANRAFTRMAGILDNRK